MISQGVSVNMGASQDEDLAANPRLKGKRFMEIFEQTVQVLRAPEFFFFGKAQARWMVDFFGIFPSDIWSNSFLFLLNPKRQIHQVDTSQRNN